MQLKLFDIFLSIAWSYACFALGQNWDDVKEYMFPKPKEMTWIEKWEKCV